MKFCRFGALTPTPIASRRCSLPAVIRLSASIASGMEKNLNDGRSVLIVACPQHKEMLSHVRTLVKTLRGNVLVWFDEAHHTVESWTAKPVANRSTNDLHTFFLHDTKHIRHRVFTSASPDVAHVKQHEEVYGELCTPITVAELIAQKWLCPISPYVFGVDKATDRADVCKYSLQHFRETRSRFGFSFHSQCKNAFALFDKHHCALYHANKTTIRPYLIVNNTFKFKRSEHTPHYAYTDIRDFESNANSLAYVVQKHVMGYDFRALDFVFLCDPKEVHSDITQCIGRGTRSDGAGSEGRNKDKVLHVLIRVYFKDDKRNKYSRVE